MNEGAGGADVPQALFYLGLLKEGLCLDSISKISVVEMSDMAPVAIITVSAF